MRVFVTGGAGFIGSHTVQALLSAGLDVTVFDDFSTGRRENLPDRRGARRGGPDRRGPMAGWAGEDRRRLRVVAGDVRDAAAVQRSMAGCELVLHLAAVVSVPESVLRPAFTHEVNALGTLNVLEAARRLGTRRVVVASSAAVYGSPRYLPLDERHPLEALSPYAAQKALAEEYAHDAVALRYFNVYGPRQDAGSPYAGVLTRFMAGQATVHGDGSQTRDFVYVGDVAQANVLALLSPFAGPGQAFNVGTGRGVSVLEAYRLITGREPRFGPARPGDVPHSVADVRLAAERLGFRAATPLEAGLAATRASFSGDLTLD